MVKKELFFYDEEAMIESMFPGVDPEEIGDIIGDLTTKDWSFTYLYYNVCQKYQQKRNIKIDNLTLQIIPVACYAYIVRENTKNHTKASYGL